MKHLAVIPARSGSTRLKDKNWIDLLGKPLIFHTIDAVIESALFDTIIVATNSLNIHQLVGESYSKVKLYWRTDHVDEKSTVVDALLDMMKDFAVHDTFSYFLPTCPFRNSDDIRQGMALLIEPVDFVVSVVEYSEPIQLACYRIDGFLFPHTRNLKSGDTNSKFMNKFYHPNGGFYMAKWNSFVNYKNFFKGNCVGYKMPKERSFDINNRFDLEVAESYGERFLRTN